MDKKQFRAECLKNAGTTFVRIGSENVALSALPPNKQQSWIDRWWNERQDKEEFSKNYNRKCTVCNQVPTVGDTGLCGPCCFGEADTVNGNW